MMIAATRPGNLFDDIIIGMDTGVNPLFAEGEPVKIRVRSPFAEGEPQKKNQ